MKKSDFAVSDMDDVEVPESPTVRFHHVTVDTQEQSLFMTMLPLEVRQKIYALLFGDTYVHVAHTRGDVEPWERENHPGQGPRWYHCVCPGSHKHQPHCHDEEYHKWRFLDAKMMLTCKKVFEESIPILYGSNTLAFNSGQELAFFKRHVGAPFENITKIDVMTRVAFDFAIDQPIDSLNYLMACGSVDFHPRPLRLRMLLNNEWPEKTPIGTENNFIMKIKPLFKQAIRNKEVKAELFFFATEFRLEKIQAHFGRKSNIKFSFGAGRVFGYFQYGDYNDDDAEAEQ